MSENEETARHGEVSQYAIVSSARKKDQGPLRMHMFHSMPYCGVSQYVFPGCVGTLEPKEIVLFPQYAIL